MRVLGLGYDGFHDSNVALLEDGKIRYAIAEERFSGVKKDGRFPSRAIKYIGTDNVNVLCISNLPDERFIQEYTRAGLTPSKETLRERERTFRHIKKFSRKFRNVVFVSHHDCHAASAYYFSGFDNALVVTWDAGNNSEPWNFTVQIGSGKNLNRVEESINGLPALNYTAITALLGFKPGQHEGKITGLAAYGTIRQNELEKVRDFLDKYNGTKSFIGSISRWKYVGSNRRTPVLKVDKGRAKKIFNELGISKENLAAIIQYLTEKQVIETIKQLKVKHSQENVCLAGGLFANVLINKRIKELSFKNIYIHPAMGDDGLALGACANYLVSRGIVPTIEDTIFWGPSYSIDEVEETLKRLGVNYYKPSYLEKDIANRLSRGQIVARFNGAMEYGPRALGNRSILASAIDKNINQILNKKLKRTEFMPFAPITLEEEKNIFYKNVGGSERAMKFMTIAIYCTERCKKENPAIVHVDGTARPQLVGNENDGLREILLEYKKKTALSTLINTSFNMHEKPIVRSPEEAVIAYKQAKLDCLAIEGFIVS